MYPVRSKMIKLHVNIVNTWYGIPSRDFKSYSSASENTWRNLVPCNVLLPYMNYLYSGVH